MSQQATLYHEETGQKCPTCGQRTTFTSRSAFEIEPHGETFWDEWLTCDRCGARTDQGEIDDTDTHPEMCEYCGKAPDPQDFDKHVTACEEQFENHGKPLDPNEDDTREDF